MELNELPANKQGDTCNVDLATSIAEALTVLRAETEWTLWKATN